MPNYSYYGLSRPRNSSTYLHQCNVSEKDILLFCAHNQCLIDYAIRKGDSGRGLAFRTLVWRDIYNKYSYELNHIILSVAESGEMLI